MRKDAAKKRIERGAPEVAPKIEGREEEGIGMTLTDAGNPVMTDPQVPILTLAAMREESLDKRKIYFQKHPIEESGLAGRKRFLGHPLPILPTRKVKN